MLLMTVAKRVRVRIPQHLVQGFFYSGQFFASPPCVVWHSFEFDQKRATGCVKKWECECNTWKIAM